MLRVLLVPARHEYGLNGGILHQRAKKTLETEQHSKR
jgi:hypothetical protein